jgi:hypothetical protein
MRWNIKTIGLRQQGLQKCPPNLEARITLGQNDLIVQEREEQSVTIFSVTD